MKTLIATGTLLCLLTLCPSLASAQNATPPDSTATDAQAIADMIQAKTDLAARVASGTETPADGVSDLKTIKIPTAMQGDVDADFGSAAVDLGQRLISLQKPSEAAAFFRAAEDALTLAIERTLDSAGVTKAQMYSKRAFVRVEFLGKGTDGLSDLDAALALTPDDPNLASLKRMLLNDKGATAALIAAAKGGTP